MRIFLGFDDTDDHDSAMGTGRLVREFGCQLPEGYTLAGIVRHQLPRLEEIPFTSNNSSACAIIDMDDDCSPDMLRDLAVKHLEAHCAPGSDPGLCLAAEADVVPAMVEFGQKATGHRLTQKEAMETARSIQLYGLGGTNDGIIGALAAVGLTRLGWCGRFIEFGRLRDLPADMHVHDLNDIGVSVVSVDRDPLVPLPGDVVTNAVWIRPSLWDGKPVLQVRNVEHGVWAPAHSKRGKHKDKARRDKPASTLSGRTQ
ncbi:hypothetical protein [Pseudodesulfovibrio portus]|uniref:ABC transporter substrate-binding protein n=1 Tax=Pseudodesulfovibrio portus TaxID=231439 RepID=A0ABM8AQC6_9BACT|nr:hypothetical protein [Pseudodesulfovibrio portus]BDQ33552.1 hypothetical protein JCM14722_10940 [Pseudodesulfovibrio portus]